MGFPEFQYREKLSSEELAAWVSTSRFGIIGCGSTIYEFASLQKPFIGIVLAENQESLAAKANRLWSCPIVLGNSNDSFRFELCRALRPFTCTTDTKIEYKFGEIDRLGVNRVMEAIQTL